MGLVLSAAAGALLLVASYPHWPGTHTATPPETSSPGTPGLSEQLVALTATAYWNCIVTAGGFASVEAELLEIEPAQSHPGGAITVKGTGGYTYMTGCGEPPVANPPRQRFQVYFDGQPVAADVTCASECVARFSVPADAAPGPHVISVGGSSQSLTLDVVAPSSSSPAPSDTPLPGAAPAI